ncbi:MAG: polyprenyl synthetase family protein [Planctomycetaceae bacterium]
MSIATSSSVDAVLGNHADNGVARRRRRATGHLKLVPESLELRERLRGECARVAATLDRSRPLTKDELEQVSRALLTSLEMPEGYLGWVMVVLSSEFWRDAVSSVPPQRRLFLLPHCLKHAAGCPAEYDQFGMNCKQCGACSIADFRGTAEEMGYRVLVAEGSPVVMKIIIGGYVDAVIGVACLNVLEKAIDKILLAGIPCMAVPLLSDDCRNTKVDEPWVDAMVRTPHVPAVRTTRTYVHLMRTAADLFSTKSLDTLAPRLRDKRSLGDAAVDRDSISQMDPIAATEHIAYDFLARGGKHSRPFITLAAYDALTGDLGTMADGAVHCEKIPPTVSRAAVSIETFHKASLVHDDIEDGDAYRYGQPAVHQRFGVATAINVGDYLIGLGYRLLSGRIDDDRRFDPAARIDVLDCLANAHTRLAEGQGAELLWRESVDKKLTPLDALKIYSLKTAPAFEAALYSGIRLAGDASKYVEPIRNFSRNLGVAFQILNDLADWDNDSTNKVVGAGDVLAGRPTLLLALALESASDHDRAELMSVLSEDSGLSSEQRIATAHRLYRSAGVFDLAMRLVDKHQQRAEAAAEQIESEALRRLFFFLIDTVLERPIESSPTVVSLGLPVTTAVGSLDR